MRGNTKIGKCDCLYKCQSNKWAGVHRIGEAEKKLTSVSILVLCVCLDHPQHLVTRWASHDKNLDQSVALHLGASLTFSPPSPSFRAHPHHGSNNALPVKRLARYTTHWLSVHCACHEHPSPFPVPRLQSVSMFPLSDSHSFLCASGPSSLW